MQGLYGKEGGREVKSTQDPRDETQRLELKNMWSWTKGIWGLKGRGTIRKTGVGQ